MSLPFALDDGRTGKDATDSSKTMLPVDNGIMGPLKNGDGSLKWVSAVQFSLPL